MGFSNGANIMEALIRSLNDNEISDKETRKNIYRSVGEVLFQMDWDTADECLDCNDNAYRELYYEWEY